MKSEGFLSKETSKWVYRDTFESIGGLVKYLKTAETSELFENRKLSSKQRKDPDENFNDFDTFEEALENLEYGYDKYFVEFKSNIQKIKDFISKRQVAKSGKFKNDVVGFMPIVPNAIIGNPINMINQNIQKKNIPVLKLIIEKGILGGVSVNDNLNFFSVVFALIDLLEQKGIRCELWECGTAVEYNEIHTYIVKLKDYMQPINIYKLQFPVISTDMHRRIGFRLRETCPGLTESGWTWGYGGTVISRNESYYNLNNGRPNKGMQEILDITDQDVYIPNVEYLHCQRKDFEYIIEKILTKTSLKDYLEIK